MALKYCLLTLWVLLIASPAFPQVLSLKNRPVFVPGEMLVRFEDDAKASDKTKVFALGESRVSVVGNVYKMRLAQGGDVLKTVESLRGVSGVRYAQPNYKYYALGCAVPTDTFYAAPYNWPLTIIQAPLGWGLLSNCPPGSGGNGGGSRHGYFPRQPRSSKCALHRLQRDLRLGRTRLFLRGLQRDSDGKRRRDHHDG